LPTQAATETEAPPQEKHAEEHAEKRHPLSRRALKHRQDAFVLAYTTPTATTYLCAAKSAEAAGYSPKTCAEQASRLMKKPRIRGLIDASLEKVAEKLTAEGAIDVAFVVRQHLEAMARCRIAGDRTNEREHLECIGRHLGVYDTSLHLDLIVKHEYDERLAVEASRIARVLIEEAGAGGLTLLDARATLAPVDVPDRQAAPGTTNAALVGESVGGEGDRPAEGTPVAQNDSGNALGRRMSEPFGTRPEHRRRDGDDGA